ncbi:MAG: hypothetical protein FWH36_04985 [Lentimicrobiaceae bacterium]|nr:hypothetical protein [Lentimicrobiaceae bacterium]
MNIKRESIGLLNELITMELSAADYQEQVTKSLRDLKRKANVPGFRPGHVPMGMIEKMYKKSLVADEVSKLTNDELTKYLTDNKLDVFFAPIAREDKTEGDFEKMDNISLSFEIGLRPEFVINYADAKKVVYYKVVAAAEEINKEIMEMRRRVGKFSSTEEVAEQDMLLVTVTPEDGGENFSSSLLLDYVKESELPLFIGKKKNEEVEMDTTKVFKGDTERSTFLKTKTDALENAPENVRIKIDAIHHRELAEIDDEFFTRLFPDGNVKNEDDLRQKIKEQIELRHVSDANAVFRLRVMEILMEKTSIELPDAFIKRYLVENKEQYSAENIEEKYGDIKKSVIYQLIEEQIVKDCGIEVVDEEITRYIENYVRISYFGTTKKLDEETEKQVDSFVEQMMKNQENVNNAYDNIFFEKMTKGLKGKLNPKSKELGFEEFLAEVANKKEKSVSKKEEKQETTETEEVKSETAEVKVKKTRTAAKTDKTDEKPKVARKRSESAAGKAKA